MHRRDGRVGGQGHKRVGSEWPEMVVLRSKTSKWGTDEFAHEGHKRVSHQGHSRRHTPRMAARGFNALRRPTKKRAPSKQGLRCPVRTILDMQHLSSSLCSAAWAHGFGETNYRPTHPSARQRSPTRRGRPAARGRAGHPQARGMSAANIAALGKRRATLEKANQQQPHGGFPKQEAPSPPKAKGVPHTFAEIPPWNWPPPAGPAHHLHTDLKDLKPVLHPQGSRLEPCGKDGAWPNSWGVPT